MKTPVKIRVNGMLRESEVEPRLLLVQFLREVCGLTGTHVGCETGICGACTILVDGTLATALGVNYSVANAFSTYGAVARAAGLPEPELEKHKLEA